jgi:2-haloacid dehalogenase
LLPPEQVMMTAAHNKDLAAAQKQGMSTAFVARPTEKGPNQTTDLKPDGNWTIVARDFGDLAGQLGA